MSVFDSYRLPVRPTRYVDAPAGRYSGTEQRGCTVFRGIHYAAAARFEAPRPETNRQSPDAVCACPQEGLQFRQTSEDCLTLNIYASDSDTRKPVLIYIHGGSFARGSNTDAQTQGHRLARALDIVVVSVNYRLGVFGFFDFSSLNAAFSKNPATLDLLLAVRFVKENIAAFGGDETNITLMGESAGGTLAALLSVLVEDDSFHKVILSSPVPTAFIDASASKRRTEAFLARLGPAAASIASMPAAQLVSEAGTFARTEGGGLTAFSPAVDGRIITHTPLSRQQAGTIVPRPAWIGVTADEMSILTLPTFAERWQIGAFLPQAMARERDGFEAAMQHLYRSVYADSDVNTQIYSDLIIRISTSWYAAEAAKHQPVWLYFFDYSGPLVTRTGLKAFHSIDLFYLFDTLPAPMRIPSNQLMVRRIQDDLKQFLFHDGLPWPNAGDGKLTAKHYRDPPDIGDLIPPEISAFWRASRHFENRLYPGFTAGNASAESV